MKRSEASQVVLERRAARKRLGAFCTYIRPGYIHADHHARLCEALERLASGESRRLIVEMPPRHGKSYHVSEAFPAWWLGRNPQHSIISSSHGDPQARRFGRKVRAMVASQRYQSLFPGTRLDQRANASDEFLTQDGGFYLAVGINGSFMGSGAHLLIVDDPFKSRSDADSPAVRASVQSAFDDLETRLQPGGAIVVMHTRWADDDLVGFIERTRIKTGLEAWDRVTMPLIKNECLTWERVEEGRGSDADCRAYDDELALWPAWYDVDYARHRRRTIPRRTWVSLYQQAPSQETGDYFLRDWIQRFRTGEQPSNVRSYVCGDFGVKAGGDMTELYRVDIDDRGHWWVTDSWYGSVTSDVWTAEAVSMIEACKPVAFVGEAGVIRRAVEPFLAMLMGEARVYAQLIWSTRTADKQASARPLQGIASMGRLHVPYCDWGNRLVDQMAAFPTSKDDHAVDALANLGLAMEQTPRAFAQPIETKAPPRDRWKDVFERARGGGVEDWKTV